MTDGLTTIDTANLTAAMKHVYQRPLNDGVVTTTSCLKHHRVRAPKSTSMKQANKRKANKADGGHERPETAAAIISIPDHSVVHVSREEQLITVPKPNPSQSHVIVSQSNKPASQPNYDKPRIDMTISPDQVQTAINQESQLADGVAQHSENVSQISPLMIKHLLSCISPLTVTDPQLLDNHGNNLKVSLENLLAAQGGGIGSTTNLNGNADLVHNSFQDVQGQVEQADTPGHVQISASLLQNLLHGIGQPFPPNSKSQSNQNVSLPSIQQFASQPLQALIQSLLPQESVGQIPSPLQTQQVSSRNLVAPENNPVFSVSNSSSLAYTVATSSLQTSELLPSPQIIQQLTAEPLQTSSTHSNLQPVMSVQYSDQQHIFNSIVNAATNHQTSKQGMQQSVCANTAQKPSLPSVSTPGAVTDGLIQVQGLPLLVQPGGLPGQPLQLIPLDRGVDLHSLREILQKMSSQQTASPDVRVVSDPSTQTTPVNVVPKFINPTLEHLLQSQQLRHDSPAVQVIASHSHNVAQANGTFQHTAEGIHVDPHSAVTVTSSGPIMHSEVPSIPDNECARTELAQLLCASQKNNTLTQVDTGQQTDGKFANTSVVSDMDLTHTQNYQISELQHLPLLAQPEAHQLHKSFTVSRQSYLPSVTCASVLHPARLIHSRTDTADHAHLQQDMNPEVIDIHHTDSLVSQGTGNQTEEVPPGYSEGRLMGSTTSQNVEHPPYQPHSHRSDSIGESVDSGEGCDNQEKADVDHPPTTFCVDCNKLLPQGCNVHKPKYEYIPDRPYLTRARATLPKCFTLQQTSTSSFKNLMGVFYVGCLAERTRFGPMVGKTVRMPNSVYMEQEHGFLPFVISKTGEETEVLMTGEEEHCNWMMFIRLAPTLLEQNCTVYCDTNKFYIVTKTEIKDEELFLWFSAEMCLNLGISQNPGNHKFNQCTECGLLFLIKRLLLSHMKSKHPEKYHYNVSCYLCSKKFKSKGKLNTHMAVHMYMKPHSCHVCKKHFSDPSNLKMHLLIHSGEKRFSCDTCGKKFRQKSHLDTHIIVHSGERNFKCPYCDKSFGRSSDLKTHTYSHTKEVVHRCTVCGKEFVKTQNLKKHMKVHTGERNYMCSKCFKGFQTKYHRDRHLKICKEKNGKEPSYMSLEEVAKLDNTFDVASIRKVSEDYGEIQ